MFALGRYRKWEPWWPGASAGWPLCPRTYASHHRDTGPNEHFITHGNTFLTLIQLVRWSWCLSRRALKSRRQLSWELGISRDVGVWINSEPSARTVTVSLPLHGILVSYCWCQQNVTKWRDGQHMLFYQISAYIGVSRAGRLTDVLWVHLWASNSGDLSRSWYVI